MVGKPRQENWAGERGYEMCVRCDRARSARGTVLSGIMYKCRKARDGACTKLRERAKRRNGVRVCEVGPASMDESSRVPRPNAAEHAANIRERWR